LKAVSDEEENLPDMHMTLPVRRLYVSDGAVNLPDGATKCPDGNTNLPDEEWSIRLIGRVIPK
jgi:hypothetical protein